MPGLLLSCMHDERILADYNAHRDAAAAYQAAYDAMYKLQFDSASRNQAFDADGNPNYRLQFVVPHPDGSGYDQTYPDCSACAITGPLRPIYKRKKAGLLPGLCCHGTHDDH